MDHDHLSTPIVSPDSPNLSSSPSNPPIQSNTVPIRIHKTTSRMLKAMITKINRKPIGKKVRADQVIAKAVSLLTDAHIEEIKESTYDAKDMLEIEYRKFCQQSGPISKDEFLKKILNAAVPQIRLDVDDDKSGGKNDATR